MKSKNILFTLIMCLFTCGIIFSGCAKFEYKLNFVVDDEIYYTINTSGNETISLPANPTKDGYNFDGWYWDEGTWLREFTANSLLNEPLSSDMKVYAKWSDEHTLKGTDAKFLNFTQVNSTTYETAVSNSTSLLNFSEIVEVANKSSWLLCLDIYATQNIPSKIATLNEGDNTYYVLVSAETGDVKLYTLNIRRKPLYEVSFDTIGQSGLESITVEEGEIIEKPTAPEKEGYTFVDWSFDFSNPITSSMQVSAIYQANKYNIIYHSSYNDNIIKQEVEYDASISLNDEIFTYNGYKIIGWESEINGETNTYLPTENLVYKFTNDIELFAVWEMVDYKITYHLESGINVNNPVTYTIEDTIILNDAVKAYYNFEGWYLDEELNNPITQINEGTFGDVDLYAKFSPISYRITYHLDGGVNGDNPATYTVESGDIWLEDASKNGYEFVGWNSYDYFNYIIKLEPEPDYSINLKLTKAQDKNSYIDEVIQGAQDGEFVMIGVNAIPSGCYGDIELYAIYELIDYNINYHLDGGINTYNPVTYNIEDETITLNAPVKEGYSFDGWYKDDEFTEPIKQITAGSFGILNLYAKWIEYDIDISYDENKIDISEEDELTSELFNATAVDTDGNVLPVLITHITGTMNAGTTIELELKAQGLYNTEITKNIFVKVYGKPNITFNRELNYLYVNENVKDFISAVDDFGNELNITIQKISGDFDLAGVVIFTATAQNNAGITSTETIYLSVLSESQAIIALYNSKDEYIDYKIVELNSDYVLTPATYWFDEENNQYTDAEGNSLIQITTKGLIKLYSYDYIITNADSLLYYMNNEIYRDGKIILLSNINLSNAQIKGISNFSGVFEGNNFIISFFELTSAYKTGFFNSTENATIKNLTLENSEIDKTTGTETFAGMLIGYAKSTEVINCITHGSVFVDTNANNVSGGLIGYAENCNISNSYSRCGVSAHGGISSTTAYSGGLVGHAINSTITDSFASGTIHASAGDVENKNGIAIARGYRSYAGGLIGYGETVEISNSYAEGLVFSLLQTSIGLHNSAYAGGLVGFGTGSIYNSYATNNISSITSCTDESQPYTAYAGGLVGNKDFEVDEDCYSTGDVFMSAKTIVEGIS